jgi:hypothetical protein
MLDDLFSSPILATDFLRLLAQYTAALAFTTNVQRNFYRVSLRFHMQREINFPANKQIVIEAIQQGCNFLTGWHGSTFSTRSSSNQDVRLALMRHLKTGLFIKVELGYAASSSTDNHTGWKISIKAPVFGRQPQVVYYCFEAPNPAKIPGDDPRRGEHFGGDAVSASGKQAHQTDFQRHP